MTPDAFNLVRVRRRAFVRTQGDIDAERNAERAYRSNAPGRSGKRPPLVSDRGDRIGSAVLLARLAGISPRMVRYYIGEGCPVLGRVWTREKRTRFNRAGSSGLSW